VGVYIRRADIAAAGVVSTERRVALIRPNDVGVTNASGELIFGLNPQLVQRANSPLREVRIIIDPRAGVVRFNMDTRQLFRVLLNEAGITPPTLPGGQPAPDPEVAADYTPGTLRVTRSDFGATTGAVTVTSYDDPSWYRQRLFINANSTVQPAPYVAGRADRLWVMFKRGSGAVGGGPALYYKVLRPGIRVTRGRIASIASNSFSVNDQTQGAAAVPEEVDPVRGLVFFPEAMEGHVLGVTYDGTSELHVVTWMEETIDSIVPMDTSVNEGSL